MKKKKTVRSHFDLAKSVRRDWNGVNPATRVFVDKTKYTRKTKHRHLYEEG